MNTTQKYEKIEINLINPDGGNTTHNFEDSGLIITGDHLMVITGKLNSMTNKTDTDHIVYKLAEVRSFTTSK